MPAPSTETRPVRSVHDPHATPHTQKRNQAVVWTAVITVGVFVLVLTLGAVDGADGQPLLHSDAVVQALITVAGVSGIVWPLLLRTSKDAAAVKDNVQNSHPGIMRDDMDAKHDGTISEIRGGNVDLLVELRALGERLEARIEGVADDVRDSRSDIRGIRIDIGRHADHLRDHDKELTKLGAPERAVERKDSAE